MLRFMTIERPDLRRDNHDLLRKVQQVWQVIEQGSMMPKVKVVSTPIILFPSNVLLIPLCFQRRDKEGTKKGRRRDEEEMVEWYHTRREEKKDCDNRKRAQQPTPFAPKSVNSNPKLLRRIRN